MSTIKTYRGRWIILPGSQRRACVRRVCSHAKYPLLISNHKRGYKPMNTRASIPAVLLACLLVKNAQPRIPPSRALERVGGGGGMWLACCWRRRGLVRSFSTNVQYLISTKHHMNYANVTSAHTHSIYSEHTTSCIANTILRQPRTPRATYAQRTHISTHCWQMQSIHKLQMHCNIYTT
jgi:hypothetical protein